MIRWLVMLVLGWAVAAQAADSPMRASTPAIKKEIVSVIEAQLAAFRNGDVAKAYALSATALRSQKPLRVFAVIVKENYPEIWTNTAVEYGLARDDGTRARMLVYVTGRDGSASYDYYLVKERLGWRIEGVLRHEAGRGERV